MIKHRKRLRCPACLVGGYTVTKAGDGRPRFVCTRCGSTWTDGQDGGPWLADAESATKEGKP